MSQQNIVQRLRGWLAGALFSLAGRLDAGYDVWLDDAPPRKPHPAATPPPPTRIDPTKSEEVNSVVFRAADRLRAAAAPLAEPPETP